MFYSQYGLRPKRKQEHSSKHSIVSNVPVVKMSARISQMILNGALVNAANVGYDYKRDEPIRDYMFEKMRIRGMDIVDRMELAQYVKEKVDNYVNTKKAELEAKATRVADDTTQASESSGTVAPDTSDGSGT